MMKTFILVMWVGGGYGGPAIVEFDSMEKCVAVKAAVEEDFPNPWIVSDPKVKCMEVIY